MAEKIEDGYIGSSSECAKCTETIIDLYIIGKLNDFIYIFGF